MHRIIKMEPVGNRFKITLDGELQFYLYKGEVRRLKLIKDNEISHREYNDIMDILYKRARERALYILDDSYKTRKQIIDKLKSGLYPDNIIYKVVEYLEEYNLINDKRYAMLYLDYKKSVYSKRKIIQDLYTKGISKELIDEAFMESDFSEDDSISSVLKKRAKRYDLSDSKDLQKLYRYLVGKGYSFSTVKKAVDNYILEQKNSLYE